MRVVVAAVIAVACVFGVLFGVPGIPGLGAEPAAAVSTDVRTPAGGFAGRVPALLTTISTLGAAEVGSYVQTHRRAIDHTLSGPGVAAQVAGWWGGLSEAKRDTLQLAAPKMLGNLDGVPFAVRGDINARALHDRLAALKNRVSSHERDSSTAHGKLEALRSIARALRPHRGGPERTLSTFDPTGQMRAAIVIGDVDTADDVSFLVPGMFYSVRGQLVDWAASAQVLYDTQRAWLDRLGYRDTTIATVAWLGYHTPGLDNVLSLDDARAGAARLDRVLAGLRAVRGDNQPYLSVLAHSYGSTAALIALRAGTVRVDALALLGSPGSAAHNVSDLDVPADSVYVASAFADPIAGSGFFGVDPASSGFGANILGVLGRVDPIDGQLLLPSLGHNGYFAPGTESMRNLALIAIGDGKLATGSHSRG